MMCLAPHPEMIKERDDPTVAGVAIGTHPVLPAFEEQVVEQPCHRLARVPAPLSGRRQGHTDRRQTGIINVHAGGHVADMHAGRRLDESELEPFPG